jgi:isopenicillin N synthase-like dioxygenase
VDGQQHIVNEWLLCRESESHPQTGGKYFDSVEGRLHFRNPNPDAEGPDPPEALGLRSVLEAYHRAMQDLAKKIERCFALALKLPENYFVASCSRAPSWPVTIAHYPRQDLEVPSPVERIDPHWDRVMFSLVTTTDEAAQQNSGGIQILLDEHGNTLDAGTGVEGTWHNVPLRTGQYCVNIGEIMTRWTNRVFKHVVHRVTNPTTVAGNTDRISLMAYVAPDYDTRIDCPLPGCLPAGEVQLYEPTWVGEMMNWEAGRGLGLYDEVKQDRMRRAQGLYAADGKQVGADELAGTVLPTDVNMVEESGAAPSGSKL